MLDGKASDVCLKYLTAFCQSCGILAHSLEAIADARRLSGTSYELLARYVFVLCDSDFCQSATQSSFDAAEILPELIFDAHSRWGGDNKFFPVFGVIVQVLLVIACILALVLVVFFWKAGREALPNLIMLACLLLSEIFLLAFWAAMLSQFSGGTRIGPLTTLGETPFLITFMILLAYGLMSVCVFFFLSFIPRLSLNWFFAMFVVFKREPPSDRAELIIRVLVWVFASLLLISVIAVNFSINGSGSEHDLHSVKSGLLFTFRLIMVVMTLFLFVCSVLCWIVVRRDESSKPVVRQGFFRMVVVSLVLLLVVCGRFFAYLFSGWSAFSELSYFFPDWFDFGIIRIFCHFVESCALLLILVFASSKFRRRSAADVLRSKDSLGAKLLGKSEENEEEGSVPLAYQI